MPIQRCTFQCSGVTLHGFYEELPESNDEQTKEVGQAMVALLNLINDTFHNTTIWAFTSHCHLKLQNTNDEHSPTYISIIGAKEYFRIEFLQPPEQQVWPYAKVTGAVTSLTEAMKYLIIVMKESGGWPESNELQEIYLKTKNNLNEEYCFKYF